jgi:Derlin-2/3
MPANVAGVNDAGDSLQSWFAAMPMVTKTFFLGTLLTGAMVSFNMLSPASCVFVWEAIRRRFEIWRLVTPYFFAGGFSFNFAMHLYLLYQNCLRYEANPYNTGAGGSSADFLWMLILAAGVHTVLAYIFEFMIFSESILYVIMYVWSRREPDGRMSMFGFKFQAVYLPWIYMGIRLIMGGSVVMPLVGVGIGHVYFFLAEVMPLSHGRSVIVTPDFCIKLMNWYTGQSSRGGRAPAPNSGAAPANVGGGGRNQGAGYNWGRGQVLGAQ